MARIDKRSKAEQAAQLIAEGRLTGAEVAREVDVSVSTLWRWHRNPKFVARVETHSARINASLARRAISFRERRVASLNSRWLKLLDVIEARAADPDHAKAPGGDTGVLAHRLKSLGSGENSVIVSEWEVDTGLLAELRAVEKQAAQELGQWAEKTDVTTNGQPIQTLIYIPANGRETGDPPAAGAAGIVAL